MGPEISSYIQLKFHPEPHAFTDSGEGKIRSVAVALDYTKLRRACKAQILSRKVFTPVSLPRGAGPSGRPARLRCR